MRVTTIQDGRPTRTQIRYRAPSGEQIPKIKAHSPTTDEKSGKSPSSGSTSGLRHFRARMRKRAIQDGGLQSTSGDVTSGSGARDFRSRMRRKTILPLNPPPQMRPKNHPYTTVVSLAFTPYPFFFYTTIQLSSKKKNYSG